MAVTRLLIAVSLLVYTSQSESIDCLSTKCKCQQPGHCQIFCDSSAGQCYGAKLRCLPGYPCTIYCLGDGPCANARISGNDATHVDLICEGSGACALGKYYCGSGDCSLQCTNSGDCTDIRVLTTGKAHSWQCTGICPSTLPVTKLATPAPTSYLHQVVPGPTIPVVVVTQPTTPAPTTPAPTLFTMAPSLTPTVPTMMPSQSPTTKMPSSVPSRTPTNFPSHFPTAPTMQPTMNPTTPTMDPTPLPTPNPTSDPSPAPSTSPTAAPSGAPSSPPSAAPSLSPTLPTQSPSISPSMPTGNPTMSPSRSPTNSPSTAPSTAPVAPPTAAPTVSPSKAPSSAPSGVPSNAPSFSPSSAPTSPPTMSPSVAPTAPPSMSPTGAPSYSPTSSPLPTEYVTCSGSGRRCACDGTRQCVIECNTKDDCKDGNLICPQGHECTVLCSGITCINARVTAPISHDFAMICQGTSTCENARIEAATANNVVYSCSGKDSCKGSGTQLSCGTGSCEMSFQGESSGDDVRIVVNSATSFKCSGVSHCPADFTSAPTKPVTMAPSTAAPTPTLPPTIPQSKILTTVAVVAGQATTTQTPCNTATICPLAQRFNEATCACQCPWRLEGTMCPTMHVWNADKCQCELSCPYEPPTAAECAYFGLVARDCSCYQSSRCCITAPINGVSSKQWAGLCWKATSQSECSVLSTDLCKWDTMNCLPEPPVNTIQLDRPCNFMDEACRWDGDCCSEYCGTNGRCW